MDARFIDPPADRTLLLFECLFMIETLIANVIQREGGFVDDPLDHGGATKYGITQRTYDDWNWSGPHGKCQVPFDS